LFWEQITSLIFKKVQREEGSKGQSSKRNRFKVISTLFITFYPQRLETFVPLQLKTAAPKINDFQTKNPSALYPTSPRQN
jgi:hypothetical protein